MGEARNRYREYRDDLNSARLSDHVRMGAAVGLVINAVFVSLDWAVYEHDFGLFLSIRLLLTVFLVFIYWRLSATHARVSQYLICLSLAAGMLLMILVADGGSSRYYAGLILLLCGMGVLLPLSAPEAGGIAAAVVGGFVGSAFLREGSVEWEDFGVSLFFLVAAAGEGIASCAFLDRLRFSDFKQRSRARACPRRAQGARPREVPLHRQRPPRAPHAAYADAGARSRRCSAASSARSPTAAQLPAHDAQQRVAPAEADQQPARPREESRASSSRSGGGRCELGAAGRRSIERARGRWPSARASRSSARPGGAAGCQRATRTRSRRWS